MLAFLNGRLISQEEARLPLHDAGFVFGATVTDLCRTFHHQLFRLEDHVARFRQSCELARILLPMGVHETVRLANELVAKNAALVPADQDLILVMFATPGPMWEFDGPPTFGIDMFPLPADRYAPLFRQGAHLVVPTTRQVPVSSVDPRIKHRSRLHWWMAGRETHQVEDGAWALLLDANGFVTETAAANFLIVKDGIVYTPPRTTILG